MRARNCFFKEMARKSAEAEVEEGEGERWEQRGKEAPLLEALVVVGLPPEAGRAALRRGPGGLRSGEGSQVFPPEVLLQYPLDGPSLVNTSAVADFCFPGQISPRIVEKTPSMSSIAKVVHGNGHLHGESPSFVFRMKAGQDGTEDIFGVCVHVDEVIHQPPPSLAQAAETAVHASPSLQANPELLQRIGAVRHAHDGAACGIEGRSATAAARAQRSRHVAVAPRAYCILSRHPFFRLHLDVLNTMIGLDRLMRIETSLRDPELTGELASMPPTTQRDRRRSDSEHERDDPEQTSSDAVKGHDGGNAEKSERSAVGRMHPTHEQHQYDLPDEERETASTASIAGSSSPMGNGHVAQHDDRNGDETALSESAGTQSSAQGVHKSEVEPCSFSVEDQSKTSFKAREEQINQTDTKETGGQFAPSRADEVKQRRADVQREMNHETFQADVESEEEDIDDELTPHSKSSMSLSEHSLSTMTATTAYNQSTAALNPNSITSAMASIEDWQSRQGELVQALATASTECWADIVQSSDTLRYAEAYARTEPPAPGKRLRFKPVTAADAISFTRPKNDSSGCDDSCQWAVAALCRTLSLETIMSFVHCVLLERQVAVVCSSLEVMSAAVMALPQLIRPLQWQSVMLPVLPESLKTILEAPVPYVVGVQRKTGNMAPLLKNVIRLSMKRDRIRLPRDLPSLPGKSELLQKLKPHYMRMQELPVKHGPLLKQADGELGLEAKSMVNAIQEWISNRLVGNLQMHSITDVSRSDKRVAVLYAESYLESFGSSGNAFARQFLQTQMFSAHSDLVLSR